MEQINTAVLNQPVQGLNLQKGPLANQLTADQTLIVFLRHFG